jgi:integrase
VDGAGDVGRGKQGGRRERPHRPHELGPRIFRRGRWFCADLRPWDGGRPTLRNPGARGWPDRGSRTEDEETARRWSWKYVDLLRDERKRADLGLRKRERPIGPLADAWHRDRERQRKAPKTIAGGRTAIMHLTDHLGAEYPVEDAGESLQSLFDRLLDAGYAPSTLDTIRRHLSAFFGWAGVEPNPARTVELPYDGPGGARAWTPGELVRLRHAADKKGLRLAAELALGTGARQGELWALEGTDFSKHNRTVHIRRQLTQQGERVGKLKSGRSRVAVVLPFVWDHLPDGGGLLLTEDDAPVKLRRSRDLFLDALEEAGLDEPGVGWHRCRHTYARLFLEAGGWMDELQRSLGHASIQTTERMYGHFAPEKEAGYAVSRIYGEGRNLRLVE